MPTATAAPTASAKASKVACKEPTGSDFWEYLDAAECAQKAGQGPTATRLANKACIELGGSTSRLGRIRCHNLGVFAPGEVANPPLVDPPAASTDAVKKKTLGERVKGLLKKKPKPDMGD